MIGRTIARALTCCPTSANSLVFSDPAREASGQHGIRVSGARRRAPIVVLGLLVCLQAHAAGQESARTWNLEALVTALSQQPEGSARYTETRTMTVLTAPVRSSGTLRYRKPDYLEKHVLRPKEEILRVEGDRLTIEDGSADSPRQFLLSEHPEISAIIESVRAPLTGNFGLLEALFQVSFGGSQRRWVLSLAPREVRVAERVRAVYVRGSGTTVTMIEIEERNGDKSVMKIEPTP